MLLHALLSAADPVPTPTPTVDPNLVTPGPIGFAAIAVVVVFVIFLIWDMQRRVRRTRYRDEVREELDAEQQAAHDARFGSSRGAAATDPVVADPDSHDPDADPDVSPR